MLAVAMHMQQGTLTVVVVEGWISANRRSGCEEVCVCGGGGFVVVQEGGSNAPAM